MLNTITMLNANTHIGPPPEHLLSVHTPHKLSLNSYHTLPDHLSLTTHNPPTTSFHVGTKSPKKYVTYNPIPAINIPLTFSNHVWNQIAVVNNIKQSSATTAYKKYREYNLNFASVSVSHPPRFFRSSSVRS